MGNRSFLARTSIFSMTVAGIMCSQPALALSGLIAGLLPAFPSLPAAPPVLENLPGFTVPDGIIPNFVLQLPLSIPNIPLPALPLPPNPESNTIASCGPGVDLRNMAFFFQNNLLPNNTVAAYARSGNGSLCPAGVFNTGGASDPMGIFPSAQDAVIASDGYLFVVNSGSSDGPLGNGSVSVFKIEPDRLTLVDVESTQGPNPRSVTRSGDLVYVANGGVYVGLLGPAISAVPASIQGFRFDVTTGNLDVIPAAHAPENDPAGDPGQIALMPDNQHVVVSNRRTTFALTSGDEPDHVEVFTLNAAGVPTKNVSFDVGGDTPFGFRVKDDKIYLSMGGPTESPNQGSSGVFKVNPDGTMATVTPATRDFGTDTCWNAISRRTDVPYFYTSAFFDSQIGKWVINPDGSMTLLDPQEASSAASGQVNYLADEGGLDMSVSVNGTDEYLYVVNSPVPFPLGVRTTSVAGFRIDHTGELTRLEQFVATGLPSSGFGASAL